MKFYLASFLFLPLTVIAADTNDLPKLVPAYGEIQPTFWEQHGTLVIIGSCAFLVLAALAVWKILQPKPAVILPPEMVARAALSQLSQQSEDGKLLSEVSQILRCYLGSVWQLPGVELTTAEFYAALVQPDKIHPSLGESISSFLRECDVRKFSPARGTDPLDAVNRALKIVAQVENEIRRRDVGDPCA